MDEYGKFPDEWATLPEEVYQKNEEDNLNYQYTDNQDNKIIKKNINKINKVVSKLVVSSAVTVVVVSQSITNAPAENHVFANTISVDTQTNVVTYEDVPYSAVLEEIQGSSENSNITIPIKPTITIETWDENCGVCNGAGICFNCNGSGELICGDCLGAGVITCLLCNGSGTITGDDGLTYDCGQCGGSGTSVCPAPTCDGDGITTCWYCMGSGRCYDCGGTGVIHFTAEYDADGNQISVTNTYATTDSEGNPITREYRIQSSDVYTQTDAPDGLFTQYRIVDNLT
ncbi:MAG: hypothetical protein Q4D13_06500 [Erysipelotrichaceae bacterium]|nr:hypothetical protein [Erysipelotrichaceae bacterium]